MGDIVKNEATAAERIGGPLPFRNDDGQFETGLAFDNATAVVPAGAIHGSFEVETYSITGGWVAANADAVELGTSGHYRLQYSLAETNHDSIIGFRLSKVGYATQYFWNRIIPAPTVPATSAQVETLLHTRVLAPLLGQNPSTTINVAPTSRTIATGADGGGDVGDLDTIDGTSQSINSVGNAVDFYYEFDVPVGHVAVNVMFAGYPFSNDDLGFFEVYATNWSATRDQIGTLQVLDPDEALDGYYNSYRGWNLLPAHTDGGTNKVRIHFVVAHGSTIGIDFDQILVGCVAVASTLSAGAITEDAFSENVKRKLFGRILDTTATIDNGGPGGVGRVTFLDAGVAYGDTDYYNGLTVRAYAAVGEGLPVLLADSQAIDTANMIVGWESGVTYICRKPWPPSALVDGTDPNDWRVLLERASGLIENEAADKMVSTLAAYSHDSNVNLAGLWKRQEAWGGGGREVATEGSNQRVKYKDREDNDVSDGLMDPATGARENSVDGDV